MSSIGEVSVEPQLRRFLEEDIGFGDLTSDSLIEDGVPAEATIICKQTGVVAGLSEASSIFRILGCKTSTFVVDGANVEADSRVLRILGPARAILAGERVVLNLVTRMSGIATATAKYVKAVGNSRVRIAATRKTAPGLAFFDKRAVSLGGGDTHRLRLDDCVIIKDNHISIVGSVAKSVKKARSRVSFTKKIEVEADTPEQALEAARAGADVVMLDNMRPKEIRGVVQLLNRLKLRKHIILEASGRVRVSSVKGFVASGVDIISVGELTHSARALDMNLELKLARKARTARRL